MLHVHVALLLEALVLDFEGDVFAVFQFLLEEALTLLGLLKVGLKLSHLPQLSFAGVFLLLELVLKRCDSFGCLLHTGKFVALLLNDLLLPHELFS